MDQDKRVAFITGAARGIGRTFAQALGEAGMGTVIADIDFETAEATAAELNAQGLNARAVKCNVADEASVDSAVKEMRSAFGRIDILINNAALHLMEWSCPVTEASSERWRQILDVNVIGIVNCARACRPYMKEAGGGVIVNQASVSGFTAVDVYGITKLAARGLTVALAKELAVDNIRVYGIAPGPMDSEAALADLPPELITRFVEDLQVIKRPGRMQDLVGTLKFFCSDGAAFITGETLIVGGGYPLRI
jgi:NAD(P)-dependent dehydrogenase (short-subunit alcohol dehydrogenase family)